MKTKNNNLENLINQNKQVIWNENTDYLTGLLKTSTQRIKELEEEINKLKGNKKDDFMDVVSSAYEIKKDQIKIDEVMKFIKENKNVISGDDINEILALFGDKSMTEIKNLNEDIKIKNNLIENKNNELKILRKQLEEIQDHKKDVWELTNLKLENEELDKWVKSLNKQIQEYRDKYNNDAYEKWLKKKYKLDLKKKLLEFLWRYDLDAKEDIEYKTIINKINQLMKNDKIKTWELIGQISDMFDFEIWEKRKLKKIYDEYKNSTDNLNKNLTNEKTTLQEKEKELKKRIEELTSDVKTKETTIQQKDTTIQQKDTDIKNLQDEKDELNEQLNKKKEEIDGLNEEKKKNTDILINMKWEETTNKAYYQGEINNLSKQIVEKEGEINNLQFEIKRKDAKIKSYEFTKSLSSWIFDTNKEPEKTDNEEILKQQEIKHQENLRELEIKYQEKLRELEIKYQENLREKLNEQDKNLRTSYDSLLNQNLESEKIDLNRIFFERKNE